MTLKVFVGFRTRPVDNLQELTPAFEPSRNLRDPELIRADLEKKQAHFAAVARDQPYTGTFDEVFLIDGKNRRPLQYLHAADGSKPPVSVRVRDYLLSAYPDAWTWDTHDVRRPTVVFIGFNPRLFLKMLGIECSLPRVGKPCPPRMWYGNSDHRDILEAVLPRDFEKSLTLPVVLKCRRPLDPEDAAKWDALLDGWHGPHVQPERDARLSLELAAQLGFLSE
jgi:hypothetical protein